MTSTRAGRYAVVGASGFVGSAIAEALEGDGHHVVRVVSPRLATKSRTVGALTSEVAGARCLDFLDEQFRGVDAVINAAGMSVATSSVHDDLFGANSLLPLVIHEAARRAGVERTIHISSAAVQGRLPVLDESSALAPFSPYSESKALAEQSLWGRGGICVFRPTSVHGPDRAVTQSLVRLARSPLASVSGSGNRPSPQVLVEDVAQAVAWCARYPGPLPSVVLQPWSGMTTSRVLEALSGRRPVRVPSLVAHGVVGAGRLLARALPRLQGVVRRVEMLWFGQAQTAGWLTTQGLSWQAEDATWRALGQSAVERGVER